jgi:hypothetical protein
LIRVWRDAFTERKGADADFVSWRGMLSSRWQERPKERRSPQGVNLIERNAPATAPSASSRFAATGFVFFTRDAARVE